MTQSKRLKAVCVRAVLTVCADATMADVSQLMHANDVQAVVVIASQVERPTVIGLVTKADIPRMESGPVPQLAPPRVSDVLSRNPLVLHEDETVQDAIRHLRARNARHAPVIGSGGTLCGLVSLDDLLGQDAA